MAAKWQQWMPLQIDRWRGSPAVRAMEPVARYGYLELLLAQWQSEDCSISSNSSDLAEDSALGDRLWEKHSVRILRNFEPLLNGRLRNAVCFEEWIEAKRIFEARSESAKRTNTTRSPSGHRAVTDTIASRSPDTITGTETVTGTKEQKATPAAFILPDWIRPEIWKDFEEMRNKIRAPLTNSARQGIVAKLDKLRSDRNDPNAVLMQSVERSYRGVFGVKESTNTHPAKRPSEGIGLDKANADKPTRAQYEAWLRQPEEYRKTHRWIHEIPEAE